jgi:NADPH-dependent glutamate synthase beta subunit-like oxidoreductase
LFNQYGTDEADQGRAAGDDADDVGAATDFLVQSLNRYLEFWE